jgi:4a-hydroxytetrahydrobiopterin dehydratase
LDRQHRHPPRRETGGVKETVRELTVTLRALGVTTAAMAKLTPKEIKAALPSVSRWQKKGSMIRRTFVFKDFPAAVKFVNAVARLAEKAWHHPDFDIRWNKVTLALTTHDEGGLTQKDFALAKKFDALA